MLLETQIAWFAVAFESDPVKQAQVYLKPVEGHSMKTLSLIKSVS